MCARWICRFAAILEVGGLAFEHGVVYRFAAAREAG